MFRLISGRNLLVLGLVACAVFLFVSPGQAPTGALQGKVVDAAGKPLEKAAVVIEFTDGINRKYEVKTNKKGEFIQIGLAPGNYKATASFEGLGEQSFPVRVRLGDPMKLEFRLGAATGATKEDAAKAAALKATFEQGVAASKEGRFDEAIAKFTEAAGMVPGCYKTAAIITRTEWGCYTLTGGNYTAKKS